MILFAKMSHLSRTLKSSRTETDFPHRKKKRKLPIHVSTKASLKGHWSNQKNISSEWQKRRTSHRFSYHPKAMLLSGWILWGWWFMDKKAPGGLCQSNGGATYLPEHKSSPSCAKWMLERGSKGLSCWSQVSWGLWENLAIACWWFYNLLVYTVYAHTHYRTHSTGFKIQNSEMSSVCFCFRSSSMFSEVWELKCLNHGF